MRKFIVIMLISILTKNGFGQTTNCTTGDCENGWGVYEWLSGASMGDKYVGEFKNGNREGVGVYTWHTGDKYPSSSHHPTDSILDGADCVGKSHSEKFFRVCDPVFFGGVRVEKKFFQSARLRV